MNLRTILKFASDRIADKLLVYFATFFLCCATFCLLILSVFTWQYLRRERIACEHCLNGGIKQAGMIYFETYWHEEESQAFLKDMLQLDEIVGVTGSSSVYFIKRNTIEEIGGKTEITNKEELSDDDLVQWLCMNPEGIDVCHFNIKEGKRPEKWNLKNQEHLIYLGSDIDDFEVGKKYYDSEEKMTYLVGGILENGTDWICDDVYMFGMITDSKYTQNLDNFIVEIDDTLINGRNTYIIKDRYRLEDVEQTLLTLAKQHGVDITLARLEDVIDENEANYAEILEYIGKMMIIIVITVIILLLCTQFSSILCDSEYFGIFYANGATTKDLAAILFGENVLKVLLSYLIAAVGIYFALKYNWQKFQPGIDNWKSVSSIYMTQTLLPAFFIGVAIILLTSVIPILWLRKKIPMELVQGYNA